MIYITIQDFYEKNATYMRLSRQEEIECAKLMKQGDSYAKERLIQSYLPIIAGHIKHMPEYMQTLGLVLYCQAGLEAAIEDFDFLQDSEPFIHRVSWIIRQAVGRYLVR